MSAVAGRRGASTSRSPLIVAVSGLVGVVSLAGVAVVTANPSGRGTDLTRSSELSSYVAAIHTPLAQGGQVVVEEMRPALADVAAGRLSPSQLAARAQSWVTALSSVKRSFDAIQAPLELSHARGFFDRSLNLYIAVAEEVEIGTAPAVASAISTGEKADAMFDQGAAITQAALRAAGLAPSRTLPNP